MATRGRSTGPYGRAIRHDRPGLDPCVHPSYHRCSGSSGGRGASRILKKSRCSSDTVPRVILARMLENAESLAQAPFAKFPPTGTSTCLYPGLDTQLGLVSQSQGSFYKGARAASIPALPPPARFAGHRGWRAAVMKAMRTREARAHEREIARHGVFAAEIRLSHGSGNGGQWRL